MRYLLLLFSICFTLVIACKTKEVISTNAFLNYTVVSAGVGSQGTALLKAWGQGGSKVEALEDAKKKALHALIFSGIPNSPDMRPLIPTPGAEQNHRKYFSSFFSKNGKYQKFASITAGSWDEVDRISTGEGVKYGVVVVVKRDLLIQELESAGVANKFGI